MRELQDTLRARNAERGADRRRFVPCEYNICKQSHRRTTQVVAALPATGYRLSRDYGRFNFLTATSRHEPPRASQPKGHTGEASKLPADSIV
jgi:hypothetical protein